MAFFVMGCEATIIKMHTRAAWKVRDGGREDGRVVPLTLVSGGYQRRVECVGVERVGLIASVRHRGGWVPGGWRRRRVRKKISLRFPVREDRFINVA
jgi:hypothetical protein